MDNKTKDQLKELNSMNVEVDFNGEKMLDDLGNYLNEAMEAWVGSNVMNYVTTKWPKPKKKEE